MTFKIVSKICASNHLIYELSWSTLAWKKALIRSHWLEITSQTLSKIYLFSNFFQAASQKWTVKPTVWCIGICSICWFFAKRLIWVGFLSKLWTFISNHRCHFWTNFYDSIYFWHLFPLGIWCENLKKNLKRHLMVIINLNYCNWLSKFAFEVMVKCLKL